MKTIIIDPGHGGYDYGAVNGSRYEKNDNLKIATLVADALKKQGQRVIMTRDSDVYIPLLDRSIISNNNKADLFVSFHRNAYTNNTANGLENYVQVNSPPSSVAYAQTVADELAKVNGTWANRGVKTGNFSVLRNTQAPSMLLELGFISNNNDNEIFDKKLNDNVAAITRGILESLGEKGGANTGGGSGGGSSGTEFAKEIQAALNRTYGSGLTVDGLYGPATKRALIRALQIELNDMFNAKLAEDGVFGSKTKAAILAVRRGDKNNLVYILQALLFFKGYNIAVDGVFGSGTESAVLQYQKNKGLYADGIAGKNTFESLLL